MPRRRPKKIAFYLTIRNLKSRVCRIKLQKACEGSFKGNLKDFPEELEWNNDDYALHAMNIDYKIMRNDTNYFSVTFEGLYNYRAVAHPIHCFYALTIEKINEELFSLTTYFALMMILSDFSKEIYTSWFVKVWQENFMCQPMMWLKLF